MNIGIPTSLARVVGIPRRLVSRESDLIDSILVSVIGAV